MTTAVANILEQARSLTPREQLELIQSLAQLVGASYKQAERNDATLAAIRRASPINSLDELAADFWPENESADDINTFVAAQRVADRMSDL